MHAELRSNGPVLPKSVPMHEVSHATTECRLQFAAFLSILLAGYTSGVLGLVLSTVLIVLFAEIVPQVKEPLASICCSSLGQCNEGA